MWHRAAALGVGGGWDTASVPLADVGNIFHSIYFKKHIIKKQFIKWSHSNNSQKARNKILN